MNQTVFLIIAALILMFFSSISIALALSSFFLPAAFFGAITLGFLALVACAELGEA